MVLRLKNVVMSWEFGLANQILVFVTGLLTVKASLMENDKNLQRQ